MIQNAISSSSNTLSLIISVICLIVILANLCVQAKRLFIYLTLRPTKNVVKNDNSNNKRLK